MQLKKQESNTNPEKAKPIASIHPILPEKRELDRWRARVEYQIEYHVLPDDPRVAVQFDEIVALMAETLCSGKKKRSAWAERNNLPRQVRHSLSDSPASILSMRCYACGAPPARSAISAGIC